MKLRSRLASLAFLGGVLASWSHAQVVPTINITAPTSVSTGATFQVTAGAADSSGHLLNLNVNRNGVYWGSASSIPSDPTRFNLSVSGNDTAPMTPGTISFYAAVTSDAASANTTATVTVVDGTAPTAPTGLSATNVTTTSFTLNWTAATDNVGVTGYTIFKNGVSTGTSSTLSFNVTGLAVSTTYNMTVKAQDLAGNFSASSATLPVTTGDTDGDGLPDAWELQYFGTLSYGATADPGGVGRTLAASYAGGLSPWPAAIVSSGLRAWYRADVAVVKDGSNKVNAWKDLSGNGLDLTQLTSSRQPLWSGTAFYNHPAVAFDGSNTMLQSATTDLLASNTTASVVVVMQPSATQVSGAMVVETTGTWDWGLHLQQDSATNRFILYHVNGSGGAAGSGAPVNTLTSQAQVVTYVKDATVLKGYLNGILTGTQGLGSGLRSTTGAVTVGSLQAGYSHFNGQVAEVLIYNRALTDTERASIETALKAKYVNPDFDADGLPDAWELQYFGITSYGATDDPGGVGRTLAASYAGGLSPWPAAIVSSGLRAWYRADVAVVKDGSNKVNAWKDLSGNGLDLTQLSSSRQPVWSGTAFYNRAALAFDGSNTMLQSATTDLLAGSATASMVVVMQPGASQVSGAMVVETTGTWDWGLHLQQDSATNRYILYHVNGSGGAAGSGAPVNTLTSQAQVVTYVKDVAVLKGYLNGVLSGTQGLGSGLRSTSGAVTVGSLQAGSSHFNGQVAEVLIYNRALTDTERASIEAALTAKYVNPDLDADGLPDAWELQYFGTTNYGATDDPGGVGRTLAASYAGGLSPWPAATVSSGLRAWYRADVAVVKDGSNKVNAWKDLSGNGLDLTQLTSSRQPLWSGTAFYNRPALTFDGSNTVMQSATTDLLASSATASMVVVMQPGVTQVSGAMVVETTTTWDWGLHLQQDSATNRYILYHINGSGGAAGSGAPVNTLTNQAQVVTYVKDAAVLKGYLNGVLTGTQGLGSGLRSTSGAITVGSFVPGNSHFNGKIAEVLIYNRALTDTERASIETALKAKYVNPDFDADGLPDAWELQYFGITSYGATDDPGGVGRTLAASYAGGLSPWPGATVSSGLRAWYRADVAVVKDGSNKVNAWKDLSGNGLDLTQLTSSRQPLWSGTAFYNHAALAFDGSNTMLQSATTDLLAGSATASVVVVMQPGATQVSGAMVVETTGTWNSGLHVQQDAATNRFILYHVNGSGGAAGSGAPVNTLTSQAQVVTYVKDATVLKGYLNGVLAGTQGLASGLQSTSGAVMVGSLQAGYSHFNGQVAEVLIYNRALTDAERQSIETALKSRYVDPPGAAGAMKLAAGGDHSMAIDSASATRASGRNVVGQLGDATAIERSLMKRVSFTGSFASVAAGESHSLALTPTGLVYTWGDNEFGQIGDGTRTERRSPVLLAGLQNVIQVAAGDHHSLALLSNGTVWAWGGNQYGQLGDGSGQSRLQPVQVSGLSGVVSVVAGANHSAALDSAGHVWTWGSNAFGQLADTSVAKRTAPAMISGLNQVVSLASGRQQMLAMLTGGSVKAWGANEAGQLGSGNTTSSAMPTTISGLTGVKSLFAGGSHSLALDMGGTVWVWGANDLGQLGNGLTIAATVPVSLSISGVSECAVGRDHVTVRKTNGTLWSWGSNQYHQLGNSTAGSFSAVPVAVDPPQD